MEFLKDFDTNLLTLFCLFTSIGATLICSIYTSIRVTSIGSNLGSSHTELSKQMMKLDRKMELIITESKEERNIMGYMDVELT